MECKFASDYPEKGVKVTKLSELDGKNWKKMRNQWGDYRMLDFALTEPFKLFTRESADNLRKITEAQIGSRFEYSTARTSCCVRGCPELVNALTAEACRTKLERIASAFAGARMKMFPVTYETSHVNVQLEPQDKPVDKRHQDSTPFVLVTILTEHSKDSGGHLLVKRGGNTKDYRCKLKTPGEAIFMQGEFDEFFCVFVVVKVSS